MIPLASALAVEDLATAARRRRGFRELDTPLALDLVPRGVRVAYGGLPGGAYYRHAERLILVGKGHPDLNGAVAHELGHHEIMTRRPGLAGDHVHHERCANWFMAAVLVRRAHLTAASVRRVARAVGVLVELVEVRRAQLLWLAAPEDEARRREVQRAHEAFDAAASGAVAQAVATLERGKEIAIDAGEIVLLADVRIGELTREMRKVAPVEKGQRRAKNVGSKREQTKSAALAAEGLSRKQAAECERIADLAATAQNPADAFASRGAA